MKNQGQAKVTSAPRAREETLDILKFGMPRFLKHLIFVILATVVWLWIAATTCFADWWVGMDENLQQVGPTAWHFSIRVPVAPVGQLQFVGSQYNFASMTDAVAVDYKFNRGGMDFISDAGGFYSIAPTLYNPMDGFMHGWDIGDLSNGTFSGVVHSSVAPAAVYFTIAADALVPMHGH